MHNESTRSQELAQRPDADENRSTVEYPGQQPDPRQQITEDYPHTVPPQALPGEVPQLPGYAIDAELGRGGFGVVYRARQPGLDQYVAIKMLIPGRTSDSRVLARFEHEAVAISRLDHENIIRILHVGRHDNCPFLVLEYLDGGTLAEHLGGNPLPNVAAARIALALADGLDAAHEAGIIHRDLKPANVLFTRDGRPKITDFGLARLGDGLNTASRDVLGTPIYMAPEQASGHAHAVTGTADVYSLGVILYEMLTGRPPFQGSALQVLKRMLEDDPPPIRTANPSASPDLALICRKCLEKDPRERFPTAAALREELHRYLDGDPLTIRPASMPERFTRWVRRRPTTAALYAAVLIAVLLGAFGVLYFRKFREADGLRLEAEVQRTAAVGAQQQAESARDQTLHEQEKTREALKRETAAKQREAELREQLARRKYVGDINLAQRAWQESRLGLLGKLLQECPEPLRNWEWHYLARLRESGRQTLRGHSGPVVSVAFSPDGQRVATSGDNAIRVWETATGKEVLALEKLPERIASLSFSPDGRRLVGYGNAHSRVYNWDAATGELARPSELHMGGFVPFAISAGGERCLTRIDPRVPSLAVRQVETRKLIATLEPKHFGGAGFSQDGKQVLTWGTITGLVELFRAADGTRIVELKNKHRGVMTAAVTDNLVALGFDEGTVSFWDPDNGAEIWTVKPHTDRIMSIAIHSRSRVLTASLDGSARLIDVQGRREATAFRGHTGKVLSAAISPDGRRVVTGGEDRLALLWEAGASQEAVTIRAHRTWGLRLALSPNGRRLATSCIDGTARVWDCETQHEVCTLRGHKEGINGVAFTSDPERVVTGSVDGTVRLWNAATGEQLRVFGPRAAVTALTVSPDGKSAVAGYVGRRLVVWDLETGQSRAEVGIGRGGGVIRALDFSPNGARLAVAEESSSLKVIDTTTWKPLQYAAVGPGTLIDAVAFFPDGIRVATAGDLDDSVVVRDTVTGEVVQTLRGHGKPVAWLDVTPDGERLVTAAQDRLVKVWDCPTGEELLTLRGHAAELEAVQVSGDGSTFATASADGLVRIWQIGPGMTKTK